MPLGFVVVLVVDDVVVVTSRMLVTVDLEKRREINDRPFEA